MKPSTVDNTSPNINPAAQPSVEERLASIRQRVLAALRARIAAGEVDAAEMADTLSRPAGERELPESSEAADSELEEPDFEECELETSAQFEPPVSKTKSAETVVEFAPSEGGFYRALSANNRVGVGKKVMVYKALDRRFENWRLECVVNASSETCEFRITGPGDQARLAFFDNDAISGTSPKGKSIRSSIGNSEQPSINGDTRFDQHLFATAVGKAAKRFLNQEPVRLAVLPDTKRSAKTGQDPPTIGWDSFATAARDGERKLWNWFDRVLRSRADAAEELSPWLELVRTKSIEKWLFDRADSYPAAAFRHGFGHVAARFLQLVFRRRLLSLRSGARPKDFLAMWRNSCRVLSLPSRLETFWDHELAELQPLPETQSKFLTNHFLSGRHSLHAEATLIAEEDRYASRLRLLAQRLAAEELPWLKYFVNELKLCSAERHSPNPFARVTARPSVGFGIAMVWDVKDDTCAPNLLRPGVIIRVNLIQPVQRDDDLIYQSARFRNCLAKDFRESLTNIRAHLGPENWIPLRADGLPDLGSGRLTGRSGGLALHVSQLLARCDSRGIGHALPPYVVISGASERENHWRAGPVSGIQAKVDAACEAGTRVLIVPESQWTEARRAARGRLTVLSHSGDAESLAATLRDRNLVWPISAGHLQWPPLPAPARVRKSPTPADLTHQDSGNAWDRLTKLVDRVYRSPVSNLDIHRDLQPQNIIYQEETRSIHEYFASCVDLWRLGKQIQAIASRLKRILYFELMQELNLSLETVHVTETVASKDVTTRKIDFKRTEDLTRHSNDNCSNHQSIDELNHSLTSQGFSIIDDCHVFNHTGPDVGCSWAPVRSANRKIAADLIHETPIELAYYTRKLRLRANSFPGESISNDSASGRHNPCLRIELSISGYGIVPLVQSGDRLHLRADWNVDEQGVFRLSQTLIVERPLPPESFDGREFDVILQAVLVNAFQDQAVFGERFDSWKCCVEPETQTAELVVCVPRNLADLEIRQCEQFESRQIESRQLQSNLLVKKFCEQGNHRWHQWKLPLSDLKNRSEAVTFALLGMWKTDR